MINIPASNVTFTTEIESNDKNEIQNIHRVQIIDKTSNSVIFESTTIGESLLFVQNNDYEKDGSNLYVKIHNDKEGDKNGN